MPESVEFSFPVLGEEKGIFFPYVPSVIFDYTLQPLVKDPPALTVVEAFKPMFGYFALLSDKRFKEVIPLTPMPGGFSASQWTALFHRLIELEVYFGTFPEEVLTHLKAEWQTLSCPESIYATWDQYSASTYTFLTDGEFGEVWVMRFALMLYLEYHRRFGFSVLSKPQEVRRLLFRADSIGVPESPEPPLVFSFVFPSSVNSQGWDRTPNGFIKPPMSFCWDSNPLDGYHWVRSFFEQIGPHTNITDPSQFPRAVAFYMQYLQGWLHGPPLDLESFMPNGCIQYPKNVKGIALHGGGSYITDLQQPPIVACDGTLVLALRKGPSPIQGVCSTTQQMNFRDLHESFRVASGCSTVVLMYKYFLRYLNVVVATITTELMGTPTSPPKDTGYGHDGWLIPEFRVRDLHGDDDLLSCGKSESPIDNKFVGWRDVGNDGLFDLPGDCPQRFLARVLLGGYTNMMRKLSAPSSPYSDGIDEVEFESATRDWPVRVTAYEQPLDSPMLQGCDALQPSKCRTQKFNPFFHPGLATTGETAFGGGSETGVPPYLLMPIFSPDFLMVASAGLKSAGVQGEFSDSGFWMHDILSYLELDTPFSGGYEHE